MNERIFSVLDAAGMGDALDIAQDLNTEYTCLYKGPRAVLLRPVAPHLFAFPIGTAFSEWYFAEGWGLSWGIFCYTTVEAAVLIQHFRRFLTVGIEGGSAFYFRFYDPRVLRRFLPTCDATQLVAFFGPVEYFWVEDEDSEYGLYFWLDEKQNNLVTRRVSRLELMQSFC